MSYYLPATFIQRERPPCRECKKPTTIESATTCAECRDSLAWERDARA